ncbi:MAG: LON peptidase substrate-binding domain-containing protein [Cryobacterium sp.]|nr:LON peptidase substrate-binding domain-containing protein [Oligoflexia bacterium]
MTEYEISLFPIPESVNLPFTILPLHIFEPRYRRLISDSIAENRRIGVSHTKRVLSPSRVSDSADIETVLKSNHETYESHGVFSAGFAKNLETLPDGRLLVQIEMDHRYEIVEELQQIPYKIVKCRPYDDVEPNDREAEDARKALDAILLGLRGEQLQPLKVLVRSSAWREASTIEYSFRIYQVIRFEAETLQQVLEMKLAVERIRFMSEFLAGLSFN